MAARISIIVLVLTVFFLEKGLAENLTRLKLHKKPLTLEGIRAQVKVLRSPYFTKSLSSKLNAFLGER